MALALYELWCCLKFLWFVLLGLLLRIFGLRKPRCLDGLILSSARLIAFVLVQDCDTCAQVCINLFFIGWLCLKLINCFNILNNKLGCTMPTVINGLELKISIQLFLLNELLTRRSILLSIACSAGAATTFSFIPNR